MFSILYTRTVHTPDIRLPTQREAHVNQRVRARRGAQINSLCVRQATHASRAGANVRATRIPACGAGSCRCVRMPCGRGHMRACGCRCGRGCGGAPASRPLSSAGDGGGRAAAASLGREEDGHGLVGVVGEVGDVVGERERERLERDQVGRRLGVISIQGCATARYRARAGAAPGRAERPEDAAVGLGAVAVLSACRPGRSP